MTDDAVRSRTPRFSCWTYIVHREIGREADNGGDGRSNMLVPLSIGFCSGYIVPPGAFRTETTWPHDQSQWCDGRVCSTPVPHGLPVHIVHIVAVSAVGNFVQ